jgi:natural product precursor
MKKVTLNKKLQLNKETIANLNKGEMNNVLGGGLPSLTCVKNSCGPVCIPQSELCPTYKCII